MRKMLLLLSLAASPALAGDFSLRSTTGAPVVSPPSGYSSADMIWDDKFASLDTSHWQTYIADQNGIWTDNGKLPLPYSGPNSGSYQLNYDDPAQLSFGSGGLTITQQPHTISYDAAYTWVSGVICSHGKWTTPATGTTYFQFRAKMPDMTQGQWPAFWHLEGGGEIDDFEGGFTKVSTPTNQVVASTLHNGGQQQTLYNAGVDLSAGWHVYGMEYSPGNTIKYYFDGTLVATYNTSIPSGQMTVIISFDVAGSLASGFRSAAGSNVGPYRMQVSEMQVYNH